jgi:hypothetical protein
MQTGEILDASLNNFNWILVLAPLSLNHHLLSTMVASLPMDGGQNLSLTKIYCYAKKSIKVHEAAELESAIDKQFSLHTDGLLPHDCHLIDHGCIAVDQMSAIGQKTWLQSIIIACEIYESEIESETTQL